MGHAWGSRDASFVALTRAAPARLAETARGGDASGSARMQGSGTVAGEAMLTSFVPHTGKVLVLVNGAYGHRAKRILDIARRETVVHETAEDVPPDLQQVEA